MRFMLPAALLLTLALVACSEETAPDGSTPTLVPDAAGEATSAPTPEATPDPTAAPTPAPVPVTVEGFGQTATDPLTPPCSICRAVFTHSGSANFIVTAFQAGEETLLVNEIGAYSGARPIFGTEPVTFDIDADGAWSLRIEPIALSGSAPFSGAGDAVSDLFDPPDDGPWELTHDGEANFIVQLHCGGGSDLVQNEIGPISGSSVVGFEDGPCLWEVEADGNWSLAPRP